MPTRSISYRYRYRCHKGANRQLHDNVMRDALICKNKAHGASTNNKPAPPPTKLIIKPAEKAMTK
jgi:hypothetical protein